MKTILHSVFLDPSLLSGSIEKNIYSRLVETLEGKCNNTHGYIRKVDPDVEILENSVSATNPGVYFKVKIKVDCSKPEIGQVYLGKIRTITPSFVFVELPDKNLVFVKKSDLSGFEIRDGAVEETGKKGGKKFKVGDSINVVITDLEYSKQKFNCIGNLVKKKK